MFNLLKRPSAWLPLALSFAALSIMLSSFAAHPVVRQPDEGTGAHLFQLWLLAEAILIGFFGLTWLPRRPKAALVVLIIQLAAVLAGCLPVYLLKL